MPKSALELAKEIHAARKNPQFWPTGLNSLLEREAYKDLLSIAKADVEAAKIFFGSYAICQQLTPLQKAHIIHHQRDNANFLNELAQDKGLLYLAQTSLFEIGKGDVNAARLLLSLPEIMPYISPQQKANILISHKEDKTFIQNINAILAQAGTNLLAIAMADRAPRGALTILANSSLQILLKPQLVNKMLTDPAFAAHELKTDDWLRILTPLERAVLILKHCRATWTAKDSHEQENFLDILLQNNSPENSLLDKIALRDPLATQLFLMSEIIQPKMITKTDDLRQRWIKTFEHVRAKQSKDRTFRSNLVEVQKFIQKYSESPYRFLDVAQNATLEQIHAAYQAKTSAVQSGKENGDKLNVANAILIDSKKREILNKILLGELGDFETCLSTMRLLADPMVSEQTAAKPEQASYLNAEQLVIINKLIEQLQTEDAEEQLATDKAQAINALEALKTYTALSIDLNQAIERVRQEYFSKLPLSLQQRIDAALAEMLKPATPAVNAADAPAPSDSETANLLAKEKSGDITNQGVSRSDMIAVALVFSLALLGAGIAIALTATGVFSPLGALFGTTSFGTMALLAANGALGFGAGLLVGGLLAFAYSLFNDSTASAHAFPVKTASPAIPKREANAAATDALHGKQYGRVLHQAALPPVKLDHPSRSDIPKPQQ